MLGQTRAFSTWTAMMLCQLAVALYKRVIGGLTYKTNLEKETGDRYDLRCNSGWLLEYWPRAMCGEAHQTRHNETCSLLQWKMAIHIGSVLMMAGIHIILVENYKSFRGVCLE